MKTAARVIAIVALAVTAMAADVSGKWSGTFTPEGQGAGTAFLVLKQNGSTLSGTAGPDENQQWPMSNGKVDSNKLTGTVTSPDGAAYNFTLTVDGDQIKGEIVVKAGDQTMKGVLDVKRVKS